MKKVRTMVVSLCILLVAGMFSAVGASTTLRLWWFPLWAGVTGTEPDGQPTDWPNAMAERFMQMYPDINVEVEMLTWDQGVQKIDIAVAAGSPPDVAYLDLAWLPKYISQGVVAPASDYFEPGDMEDFFESTTDYARYDDKVYAYPFLIVPRVFYANKTLLEEMGIAHLLPQNDDKSWTIEEFKKIAEHFPYNKDGKTIWAADISTTRGDFDYFLWLWNFGATLYNTDQTEFLLNSPEGLAGLTFLNDMIQKGVFKLTTGGAQRADFWAGETAFGVGFAYPVETLQARLENTFGDNPPEVVALQFPRGAGLENAKTYSGIGGVVVFKQRRGSEEQVAAAMKLAAFLTNAENTKAVKAIGAFPPRRSAGDVYGNDPVAAIAKSMLPYGEDLGKGEVTNQIFLNVVAPELEAAFTGIKTVEKALEDMERKANSLLQ